MIRNIGLPRICFFVFLLLSATIGQAQLKRFSFTQKKMASPFTIIVYTEDSSRAKLLANQSFLLVDSLVNIFSDYLPNSELNQLCATAGTGAAFQCSPALFQILGASQEAFRMSECTFDITVGPLSRLWREARKTKTFPDSALIKETLRLVGFDKIQLDPSSRSAKLSEMGMQLDLGGIAQGYIGQRVIDFLESKKVENALVDVSGDIVCLGQPPGTRGWNIAVNQPESSAGLLPKQLSISNAAVTTSGDMFQFFEHGGKRYSHVIDPRTGYGITSQRNVTVIAQNGTLADWLTKACSLLPIAKAKRLAMRFNAAVLIVERRKSKFVFYSSKNFNHFWKKP